MQTLEVSAKCVVCDILLAGREQFVGHMIHGHDMGFEKADALWESTSTRTGQKGTGDGKCHTI